MSKKKKHSAGRAVRDAPLDRVHQRSEGSPLGAAFLSVDGWDILCSNGWQPVWKCPEVMAEDVILRLLRLTVHDGTFLSLPLGGRNAGTLFLLMLNMRNRMLWVVWFVAHDLLFLLFLLVFVRQQIVAGLGWRNNTMP